MKESLWRFLNTYLELEALNAPEAPLEEIMKRIEQEESEQVQWAVADEFEHESNGVKRVFRMLYPTQSPKPSPQSLNRLRNSIQRLDLAADQRLDLVAKTSTEKSAVIIDRAGGKHDGSVIFTHGPFLSDRCELVMRITVQIKNDKLDAVSYEAPMKLSIDFCPIGSDHIVLCEIAELWGRIDQLVKISLPPEILEQEWFPEVRRDRVLEDLPVRFALQEGEMHGSSNDNEAFAAEE